MKKCFRIIFSVVVLTALFTIGVSAAGEGNCSVVHDSTNGIPLTKCGTLDQEGGTYYLDNDITTTTLDLVLLSILQT